MKTVDQLKTKQIWVTWPIYMKLPYIALWTSGISFQREGVNHELSNGQSYSKQQQKIKQIQLVPLQHCVFTVSLMIMTMRMTMKMTLTVMMTPTTTMAMTMTWRWHWTAADGEGDKGGPRFQSIAFFLT